MAKHSMVQVSLDQPNMPSITPAVQLSVTCLSVQLSKGMAFVPSVGASTQPVLLLLLSWVHVLVTTQSEFVHTAVAVPE